MKNPFFGRRVGKTASLLLLFLILSLTLPATPIVRGQTLAPTVMRFYGLCSSFYGLFGGTSGVVAVNVPVWCFPEVIDTSANPTTPNGSVTFSACCDPTGAPFPISTFTPSSTCTLESNSVSRIEGIAFCPNVINGPPVFYTPSPGSEGPQTITATYAGDLTHSGSSATFSLQVTKRPSSTTVSCSPNGIGHTIRCEATVIDFPYFVYSCCNPITPTGTVAWSSSASLIFRPTSCTLSDTNITGTASCIATYRVSPNPGYQQIVATYDGDTDHFGSSSNTRVVG